jgi:hypothetical protein
MHKNENKNNYKTYGQQPVTCMQFNITFEISAVERLHDSSSSLQVFTWIVCLFWQLSGKLYTWPAARAMSSDNKDVSLLYELLYRIETI